MRERWPSTVFGETKSSEATSFVARPSATSSATRSLGRCQRRPTRARGPRCSRARSERARPIGVPPGARMPRAPRRASLGQRACCFARRSSDPRMSSVRARSNGIRMRSCSTNADSNAASPSSCRPRAVSSNPLARPAAARAEGRSSRRARSSSRERSASASSTRPSDDEGLDLVGHEAHRSRLPDPGVLHALDERSEMAIRVGGVLERAARGSRARRWRASCRTWLPSGPTCRARARRCPAPRRRARGERAEDSALPRGLPAETAVLSEARPRAPLLRPAMLAPSRL